MAHLSQPVLCALGRHYRGLPALYEQCAGLVRHATRLVFRSTVHTDQRMWAMRLLKAAARELGPLDLALQEVHDVVLQLYVSLGIHGMAYRRQAFLDALPALTDDRLGPYLLAMTGLDSDELERCACSDDPQRALDPDCLERVFHYRETRALHAHLRPGAKVTAAEVALKWGWGH